MLPDPAENNRADSSVDVESASGEAWPEAFAARISREFEGSLLASKGPEQLLRRRSSHARIELPWRKGPQLVVSTDELRVVRATAKGDRVLAIAQVLHLSKRAVEHRLCHVKRKLGARNSAHLVAMAVEMGLIILEPEQLWHRLTPKELEVIKLVSLGLGNRDIAIRLAISEPTVSYRLQHAREKTGCSTRCELAAQYATAQRQRQARRRL